MARSRVTPSAKTRLAVYERDGFACRTCGWEPDPPLPGYGGERALTGYGPAYLAERGLFDKPDIYRRRVYALELDHVVPFSQGGRNAVDNYQALCSGCNARKGAKAS